MMLPLLSQAQDCCQKSNDVIETIMSRRSIRKYLNKPVEHEKLAIVAKCGINAPNALNQQAWAVRVVEDQNFIKETTEIFRKEKPEMVKRDTNFKNTIATLQISSSSPLPRETTGDAQRRSIGREHDDCRQGVGIGHTLSGKRGSFLARL